MNFINQKLLFLLKFNSNRTMRWTHFQALWNFKIKTVFFGSVFSIGNKDVVLAIWLHILPKANEEQLLSRSSHTYRIVFFLSTNTESTQFLLLHSNWLEFVVLFLLDSWFVNKKNLIMQRQLKYKHFGIAWQLKYSLLFFGSDNTFFCSLYVNHSGSLFSKWAQCLISL